jgi:hypothetical protein
MAARRKTASGQLTFEAKGFSRNIGVIWGKALIKRFGTTDDPSHAAFITPDGKLVKYHKLTHGGMTRETAKDVDAPCGGYSKPSCLKLFLRQGGIKIHDWEKQGGAEYEAARPNGPLVIELHRTHKITRAQAVPLMKFVSARYREEPPSVDVTIHGNDYGQEASCYLYPEPAGRRRLQLVQCLRSKLDVRPSIPFDGVKLRSKRR